VTTKLAALAGSLLFLVVAPGTIAGYIPWRITRWQIDEPFFGIAAFRAIGFVLLVSGSIFLLESFARFALKGDGTPAPVMPTKRLVVSGSYRYVRNPMYVGVLAMIVGQALVFGSIALLAYAVLMWLIVHLFVVLYEERVLGAAYGAQYHAFRANVPRWLPRLSPWTGGES
jgi:protein-S-isoprenylcysteine O-methyltransferase Ste14